MTSSRTVLSAIALLAIAPRAPTQFTLLANLSPGSGSTSFTSWAEASGILFFSAGVNTTTTKLFRTGGTTSSTRVVEEPSAGGPIGPTDLTEVGGRVFFVAGSTGTGRELWVSDGTAAGTYEVRDIAPGTASSDPIWLFSFRDKIYFGAKTAAGQRQTTLWASDGTRAGTQPITRRGGAAVVNPSWFANLGDKMLFAATGNSAVGTELWISGGTSNDTELLADISPGAFSSSPKYLTVAGGVCYFSATHRASGNELFRTDGTTKGTRIVTDLTGSTTSSTPQDLIAAGHLLYFTAKVPRYGRALFQTNSRTGSTTRLTDTSASPRPGLRYAAPIGSRLIFRAWSSATGQEPMITDGTAAGTLRLKDIHPSGSSDPFAFYSFGSRVVYFSATTPGEGTELWRTDGTKAGTQMVVDHCFGTCSFKPVNKLRYGCKLIVNGRTPLAGEELWWMPLDTAESQPYRPGCMRRPGPVPGLEVEDPVLGQSITIRGLHGPKQTVAYLMLGVPADIPLRVEGCPLWINGIAPMLTSAFRSPSAEWTLKVAVPNDPGLRCSPFAMQCAYADAQGLVGTTNTLRVFAGR